MGAVPDVSRPVLGTAEGLGWLWVAGDQEEAPRHGDG